MTKSVAIMHFAAPPIIGGVESTIYHHARLLAEVGYEVTVVAGRGESFHPEVEVQIIQEIDSRHPFVLEVGNELARGEVSSQFSLIRDNLIEQLQPILANIDVCIVHNAITLHKNFPLTAALKRLNEQTDIPMIAWCHDFAWQDPLYTPDLHTGYPWDLLNTPWPGIQYVVVSTHRRDRLADLFDVPPLEIQVIHPGVDTDRFYKFEPLTQRLVQELHLHQANPLLLLPARITRRKNIQFSIRVTAALKQIYPQVALVITGPLGPHNPKNIAYLESLNDLRHELEIASSVHFLYEHGVGDRPLQVPDDVVADFYHLADAMFFPSLREGFGIPVLEAGLARIPVYAANIPSVLESAGEFAHLFDPENDPEIVAKFIADTLEFDQAFQLRQRVLVKFTWKAILKNDLIPLIEKVGSK